MTNREARQCDRIGGTDPLAPGVWLRAGHRHLSRIAAQGVVLVEPSRIRDTAEPGEDATAHVNGPGGRTELRRLPPNTIDEVPL